MIRLEQLRHAVMVAQEGSFVAAAQLIPLSQSALTRSIQSLEREYKLQIFERSRLGVQLTPEGGQFIETAQQIIQAAQSGDDDLRTAGARDAALTRFGMGSISATAFFPALLLPLTKAAPNYRVLLGSSAALRGALRRKEIDFYVAGVPRHSDYFATSSDLHIERVAGNHLDLLVRPQHPLLEMPSITSKDIARYPTGAGTFVRETIGAAVLEPFGIGLPKIEIDDYEVLAAVARQSDLIVIGSHLFRQLRPDLGLAVLPYDITSIGRSDWAVVSSRSRMSRDARELSQVVLAMLRKATQTPLA